MYLLVQLNHKKKTKSLFESVREFNCKHQTIENCNVYSFIDGGMGEICMDWGAIFF